MKKAVTVVLGYHHVTSFICNKRYAIPVHLFKEHLLWLKNNNRRVISLRQLYHSIKSNAKSLGDCVVLTFDDGLLSHFEIAFPLLKEFGFPACFFVIANFVGKQGYMHWGQLKEMLGAGMEVGSHGLSHNLLNIMSDDEVREELLVSRSILEKNLNTKIDFLSIPRGQDNLKIKTIALDLGYEMVCSSRPGYVRWDTSPFYLNRFLLRKSDSFTDFKKIVEKDSWVNFKIKVRRLFFALARYILGMRLYERIRMVILRDEYSH